MSKVLARLVSGNTLKALYAEDRKTVVRELMYNREEGMVCPVTNMELAKVLRKGYAARLAELQNSYDNLVEDDGGYSDGDDNDSDTYSNPGPSQKEYYTALLAEVKNQLECFKYLDDGSEGSNESTKVEFCVNFAVANPDAKIIVFSEFPRTLDYMADDLRMAKVPFVDLEGGNMRAMHEAQNKYKHGNARVLLAHSTMFSCGMNLENTTHIIIMHALPTKLREQVVGRGQRPGRTCPLTVISLLYPGEKEALAPGKNTNVSLNATYEWSTEKEDEQFMRLNATEKRE